MLGFAGGAALRARTEVLLLGQDDRLEVAAQSPEGGKEVEGGEEGAGAEVLLSAFPAKAGTLGITFARHDNLTLVRHSAPLSHPTPCPCNLLLLLHRLHAILSGPC